LAKELIHSDLSLVGSRTSLFKFRDVLSCDM
jgi:hypothetical protein